MNMIVHKYYPIPGDIVRKNTGSQPMRVLESMNHYLVVSYLNSKKVTRRYVKRNTVVPVDNVFRLTLTAA